ncbi:MAG: NADH-quinone oxidoreductase subunit J [Bdellovibrionales bacterium]|nr:NADH-quinone oxidoreductase subunit J [Bdellovibrionales bacterium]
MPIISENLLFFILASTAIISALVVVLQTNPIFCALALAMTMISVAGIFAALGAWFVAGVQLIVYAGAVMVLFVMVLMLFDLKDEVKAFSRGLVSGMLKIASVAVIGGVIVAAIWMSAETLFPSTATTAQVTATQSTKQLADLLFKKYLFSFEAMGALLLFIAIGAVALSRIEGGTHADN